MDKETKKKYTVSVGCMLLGVFYILEGLNITHFGKKVEGNPDFLIVFVGIIFLIGSAMLLLGHKERLNNFLASLLTFIMGLIAGWISLYADSSGFSGSGALLSRLTGLPLGKIMFGIGSVMCFVVSVIAFRMFLKPK